MESRQNPEDMLRSIQTEETDSSRGSLKIFFGYAPGVGKTYAMLEAARAAKNRGIDVVVGYIDAHERPETAALLEGLEKLPKKQVNRHGVFLKEFDLDCAMERNPQLILIDELAHANAEGCRHLKRYQDIEELLQAGIDVYTTVNVQNIESLKDTVASITEVFVRERIPDRIFDGADFVELVDIEPKDLMDRIHAGKVYGRNHSRKGLENRFTLENLTALREIALRRCADHVNRVTENARGKNSNDYHTGEHILVCLSPSPSNEKTIRTAARMARAFRGTFTALFVETPDYEYLSEEDADRLQSNIRLARQLEAKIETVYGDDIPLQIAEFARLSGVSKIVVGRSSVKRKGIFYKQSLTDKLITNAPNMDIHIIPDGIPTASVYRKGKLAYQKRVRPSLMDFLKTISILLIASCIGMLFYHLGFAEANIITVYVLGVLIVSVITTSRFYSLISAIGSVLVFNFLFTDPVFTLHAYGQGYPMTFLVMFLSALLTGTLATKLKNNAKQSAYAAFRTKVLFDTNQIIQQSKNSDEILTNTAQQLVKLLGKDLVIYPAQGDQLGEPKIFVDGEELTPEDENYMEEAQKYLTDSEREVAAWVVKNNKHAGATTQTLSSAKCYYLSIRVNNRVYGVVGILVGEDRVEAFENSIILSILGECALALENEKNAREAEEAAVLAKNEQLRANLLRTISHDLRTPLTSISGNASNLLSNEEFLDRETIHQIYSDIYDDSMWLINLVENLLSVTRLEQGQLNLNISDNLVEDVITEALCHVNRKKVEHQIKVTCEDDLLLAKMDGKLIVQVIINIVDNAIKYTPRNSCIEISTKRDGKWAVISIADDGPGISEEIKAHVFDMFYSGANKIADSRRSLGLGLALCKSIINAHGGTITVENGEHGGTVFTFTLLAGEVHLHE